MTISEVYTQLLVTIGAEEFGTRCKARDALYNEYGFTPDLTRIHIYDIENDGIRFGVGRHVYQLEGNQLTKVE